MTKVFLRALFFLLPFLYSIYVSAQPRQQRDCSTTCFSSELVSAEKLSGTCTAYVLNVSYSGDCAHALSHFTVAIPCGSVSDIWNSQGWAQAVGTDPTTGLTGFKIDDIRNFGEGSLKSFTVKFTLCSTEESCAAQMACWQPQVAYKASTCINYDTLAVPCRALKASLDKKDVSCFNANDGSLSVIVEQGQAPYTFLWSNNATGESLVNLSAGTYSVIVRDASGSETTLEATLAQPAAIETSATTTPASCNGVSNGAIDLSVSGGKAPYTFHWNNGATTEDLHDLPSGQYNVVVKDANGCAANAAFVIDNTATITVDGVVENPDCSATNGAIDLTVTGGSMPYTFSWLDGVATEDRERVGGGVYIVVVKDQNGCSTKASFVVNENNTLALTADVMPSDCDDAATGSIDVTVVGGTAPYTFVWSDGSSTEDLSALSSGYYTVTVTDAKGCTARRGYAVSKRTFQVPRVVQQPSCHDGADGAIILQEPVGGTPPYTYVWSRNNETGSSLNDVAAGDYSVVVTDAAGCSQTLRFTISNPPAIAASAGISNTACNSEGFYSIDLSVSGGTAPYSYSWSDGYAGEDRSGLPSGTFTVVITDAKGCTLTKEIAVTGAAPTWSCLIEEPSGSPACGSTNNTLSSAVADADAYTWTVESSDGAWSIVNANSRTIGFTAGGANSTATFTLTVVKDGCTKTCNYTVTSCTPTDDGGTDPGTDDPDGNPDDDLPGDGEEDGSDNGDTPFCETCFESVVTLVSVSDECRTYTAQISTNGLCRHDLSHWTLAIPCGTVSNYSNSAGWKMTFGKDPTTGLYGLKVDDIDHFGKDADTFTVRFTVCETSDCDLSDWRPVAAYKAGLCVATEPVAVHNETQEAVSVYPNPFTETVNFEWQSAHQTVQLQIIDQYGNSLSTRARHEEDNGRNFLVLESSALPKGMYYYRLTLDGHTYHGKLSKR